MSERICEICGDVLGFQESFIRTRKGIRHDFECWPGKFRQRYQALQDELAADRERCERYNAMAGKDADELAQLRANLADALKALDLVITERDKYADDAAAMAAALEAEHKYALDGLAERCECASSAMRCGACVQRDHILKNNPNYAAILAARDTDQWRKGAAWALRQIGCTCPWAGRGTHDEECVLTLLAAIERGEVEVGE